MSDRTDSLLGGLVAGSHLVDFDGLAAYVADRAEPFGMHNVGIYVADLQQQFLAEIPSDGSATPTERLPVDASMAGRAFRAVRPVRGHGLDLVAEDAAGDNVRVWAPMVDGAERIGVLAVDVVEATNEVLQLVQQLASLVALLVVSKRYSSDTYARLVRTQPLTLAAEVLWTLMPVSTFANERVVLTAALEPAYTVGGDAFDYAVDRDVLHLKIFDAMGNDTAAGLTASIAMGSCRNNRRRGADLPAEAAAIDADIAAQFGGSRFATGILADLDTRTGLLTWINHAHPPPLLIRGGRVSELASDPGTPFGLQLGVPAAVAQHHLAAGDRLLLFTDGIVEARNPQGEQFGLDRFTDFVVRQETAELPAPETVRRLVRAILEHQGGRLNDDATVLLVEWRSDRSDRLVPERQIADAGSAHEH